MKKHFVIIILSHLIWLYGMSGVGCASPYRYLVNGTAYADQDPSQSLLNISGYIDINPPVYHNLEPGSFLPSEDHNQYFSFDISSFYLDIGDYSFYSIADMIGSAIYSHHYYYGPDSINPSFTVSFDDFYLIGTGDWQSWDFISSSANFFYQDGTQFSTTGLPTDFYNLPYMIKGNGIYGKDIYLNELTISQIPVPAPSSFILLSIGMLGCVLRRKHWKR